MAHGQGTWDPQYGTWEPDDPKYFCEKCECEVNEEDFNEELDMFICSSCLEEYAPCCDCGHLTHFDDIEEIDGKQFCADCAAERNID